MELLPLIPENVHNHDIEHCIREFFQTSTRVNIFPANIAENLVNNFVDPEIGSVKLRALEVLKHTEKCQGISEEISVIEETLMRNHAEGLLILSTFPPTLKRQDIYRELSGKAAEMFSLLQDADFLPSRIEQFLDFTFNPSLHTCKQPCPFYRIPFKLPPRPIGKVVEKIAEICLPDNIFLPDQEQIVFRNYQLNHTYRKKLKLLNSAPNPQSISLSPIAKSGYFTVKMLTESSRIATGMCAEFLITFHPENYAHHYEMLNFIIPGAQNLNIEVYSARDAPRLKCFVVNAVTLMTSIEKPKPGTQFFSDRRCNALNMTIDCGSCLLGNYNVVSVVMKNDGEKGEFFITTEQEWFFAELEGTDTRDLELIQGCFSLFPIHFELDTNEIGEFFIIFAPNHFGLYSEKLVVLCDNNAHQEIELVGDCIAFQYDFLKVDLFLSDEHILHNKSHITINLETRESTTFLLAVYNKSPVHFEYYWGISKDITKGPDKYFMDPDWLKIKNCTTSLPSNSETDFAVTITANTDSIGEFYTRISLYLKSVPVPSMADYEQFVVRKTDNRTTAAECECKDCVKSVASLHSGDSFEESICGTCALATADVHICQLMISCSVRVAEEVHSIAKDEVSEISEKLHKKHKPKVRLSKHCMKFGLLPAGVEASRTVTIVNLTEDDVEWYLIECQIEPDMTIQIENPTTEHFNHRKGIVKKYRKKQTVTYRFKTDKDTRQWISILILLSTSRKSPKLHADSCCLVIYEIAENLVEITTDTNPHMPLICPKQLVYPRIPIVHTIFIKNFGHLPSCYCFLKPRGRDKDKMQLKYESHSGIIKSGCEIALRIEITALEAGILDDFQVPCFVGDVDKLISLNIVCVVVGISVYIYLPRGDGFMKILWPPDTNQHLMWPLQKHEPTEYAGEDFHEQSKSESTLEPPMNESLKSLIGFNSIAATYPTVKVLNIPNRTPTKVTFFIENITPVCANFSVEALNFGTREPCLNNFMVRTRTKNAREFWEKACLEGFGIVVDTDTPSGDLIEQEVKEINLWIYANTWGRYLEEVNVEIDELTPFCFNLCMDVMGLPLEFPFALNTIRKEPVFRLGYLNYYSASTRRTIKVMNISSIPVHVTWHMFQKSKKQKHKDGFNFIMDLDYRMNARFVLTNHYYGEELSNYIDMEPAAATINQQETCVFSLDFDLTGIIDDAENEEVDIDYTLVGFIHIHEEYQFKENYYRRFSGMKLDPLKLILTGVVEVPNLTFDFTEEDTKIHVFANDILLGDCKSVHFYLVFKNLDRSTINTSTFVDPPFKIAQIKKCDACVRGDVELKTNECVQIVVKCVFKHEELLKIAEMIYNERDGHPRKHLSNLKSAIIRNLFLKQGGFIRQIVPMQVILHFPQIEVNPTFIKFGACLLYNTKKTILSIYNLSGSKVRFEIYKTSKADDFEVNPNHGEVPRNTGANKQFVDITVYFTPRECKKYTEIIRIITNIPQYFIDVPLIGYGSNNEKFHVV